MYDLNVIERGIRGLFGREFVTRQRRVKYTRFSTIVNSDKQTEKFNAISTLPQLQEIGDERVLAGFSEYSYELTNKVYATGIRIPRTVFEFDQTGQLRTLVQSLGSRVANFPDKLLFSVMGENGVCYDGSNFFATDHDLGNGTSQVNVIDGNLSDTLLNGTTAENRDDAIAAFQLDLVRAKAALLGFTDDRGEPWHEDAEPEDLIILCHPAAEFFIRTAVEATVINSTGNMTVKSVGGLITSNYSDPFKVSGTLRKGTWYLMKVNTPVQPMLFQRFSPRVEFPDKIAEEDQQMLQALNSVEVQTVMRTGQSIDATTFFNDEFLFGARTIYSAGFGIWQNAIKINGKA